MDSGFKLGNYKDNGLGAHQIEAGLFYSGSEKFPLSICIGANVYNDPGNITL
ncbi:MAG: hypothetical protein KJ799_16755 [Bacteroidetes bacterium]|nr:hypothetical protein [Bacteroidota bacterium]MBU2508349.1 hypothetical protein [Bacteroidota bacterium]